MPNDTARLGNSSPLLNTMTLIEHSIVVLLVVLTVLWPFGGNGAPSVNRSTNLTDRSVPCMSDEQITDVLECCHAWGDGT